MIINKRLLNIYIQMMLVGAGIMVYFIFIKYIFKKNAVYNDPFNKKRFYIPGYGKISAWPMSHIVAHAVWTYNFPEYWYHITFMGIVWEIVEYFFKIILTPKGKKLKFKRTRNEKNDIEYTTWWDSSTKDIIWNSVGQIIGYSLYKIIK